MSEASSQDRDVERRQAIVAAARACFLQFGYAKTSLDDIAQRAGISRPLIYRKFRNKEEILSALFESLFEQRYPQIEAVLAGSGDKRDKLMRVYELLLLEPWDELIGSPMAAEFYDVCSRLVPEVEARHEKRRLKYTQAILGAKDLAEIFILASDGLTGDLPGTTVLRRRLALLIDRFV